MKTSSVKFTLIITVILVISCGKEIHIGRHDNGDFSGTETKKIIYFCEWPLDYWNVTIKWQYCCRARKMLGRIDDREDRGQGGQRSGR